MKLCSPAPARLLLAAVLVTTGCASWERVERPDVTDPDGKFSARLPTGWVRDLKQGDIVFITRDGPEIQSIGLRSMPREEAFPLIKRVPPRDAPPMDLSEMAIAELKAQLGGTEVRVLDNAPAECHGARGFRLFFSMNDQRGLEMMIVSYGFMKGDRVYELDYGAPALYYFQRDLPVFEQVVRDFQPLATS